MVTCMFTGSGFVKQIFILCSKSKVCIKVCTQSKVADAFTVKMHLNDVTIKHKHHVIGAYVEKKKKKKNALSRFSCWL